MANMTKEQKETAAKFMAIFFTTGGALAFQNGVANAASAHQLFSAANDTVGAQASSNINLLSGTRPTFEFVKGLVERGGDQVIVSTREPGKFQLGTEECNSEMVTFHAFLPASRPGEVTLADLYGKLPAPRPEIPAGSNIVPVNNSNLPASDEWLSARNADGLNTFLFASKTIDSNSMVFRFVASASPYVLDEASGTLVYGRTPAQLTIDAANANNSVPGQPGGDIDPPVTTVLPNPPNPFADLNLLTANPSGIPSNQLASRAANLSLGINITGRTGSFVGANNDVYMFRVKVSELTNGQGSYVPGNNLPAPQPHQPNDNSVPMAGINNPVDDETIRILKERNNPADRVFLFWTTDGTGNREALTAVIVANGQRYNDANGQPINGFTLEQLEATRAASTHSIRQPEGGNESGGGGGGGGGGCNANGTGAATAAAATLPLWLMLKNRKENMAASAKSGVLQVQKKAAADKEPKVKNR